MNDLYRLLEENTSGFGSFCIYFNEHKSVYESVIDYYRESIEDSFKNVDINKNIYWLCWYKDTPIGSYDVFANTIEELYQKVLALLEEIKKNE